MVTRVPVERAETALVELVGSALMAVPEWIDAAISAMRRAIADISAVVPVALAADEKRLSHLDKSISNLVDALAEGPEESPAIRARLTALESDAANLREQIGQQRALLAKSVGMPSDAWIHDQLVDLAPLRRISVNTSWEVAAGTASDSRVSSFIRRTPSALVGRFGAETHTEGTPPFSSRHPQLSVISPNCPLLNCLTTVDDPRTAAHIQQPLS